MAEVTSSHVVAQFKYSYEYEGKTISFKKGETFQLLNTTNKDWWQVRRWLEDGTCESLYVPANYMKMKEKEEDSSHLYQNVKDLQDDYKRIKEQLDKKEQPAEKTKRDQPAEKTKREPAEKKVPPPTQPKTSPKMNRPKPNAKPDRPLPGNSHHGNKPHLPPSTEPEYAVPHSPQVTRKDVAPKVEAPPTSAPGQITQEWQPGYALPAPKKRSHTALNSTEESSSLDIGPRKLVPGVFEGNHLHQLELTLSQQMNTSSSNLSSSVPGIPSSRGVPVGLKPKPSKANAVRPKSYCIDDETNHSEVSTFKISATSFGIPEEPTANNEPHPQPRKSYKRPDYNPTASQGGHPLKSNNSNSSVAAVSNTPKPVQIPHPVSLPSTPVTPVIATSSPTPSPVSPLPAGWSEHKTPEGRVYYYNSITNESKWTMPTATGPTLSSAQLSSSHLERVAPRGWTKEINPLSQTPIYTNCRTREKWALAKDDRGYYYYNTADTSQVLRDLPSVDDPSPEASPMRSVSDTIYDHLTPVELIQKRGRTLSEDDSVAPREHPRLEGKASHPVGIPASQELDMWSSMLSSAQTKHGYLHKKRLVEPNGKKLKNDKWMKLFVVLQDNQLLFYTDHKTKDNPGVKPVSTFSLVLSSITTANLKDKKKLQVTSLTGEQFYLQADTPQMLNNWYATLQASIDQANVDYKNNPDKYEAFIASLETTDKSSDSPPTQIKFGGNRKASLPRTIDDDDCEELEFLSGVEKTMRIKGRLRNLIAKRPQVELLKKQGIIQDSVFGCELSHLTEREHRYVPQFFTHLIEHIEKKGLTTVGIYRLSGNAAQVQKLRYLVEEDPLVNLSGPEWADINIITGCLKLYLRELPDPLIPFKHFRPFIEATKMQPNERKLAAIKAEIDKLPQPNYHTLATLVKHLQKVVEHGSVNKMFANNVGIVFGPTVMRAEVDSIEMATLMPIQNNLMETFITECDKLFKK